MVMVPVLKDWVQGLAEDWAGEVVGKEWDEAVPRIVSVRPVDNEFPTAAEFLASKCHVQTVVARWPVIIVRREQSRQKGMSNENLYLFDRA